MPRQIGTVECFIQNYTRILPRFFPELSSTCQPLFFLYFLHYCLFLSLNYISVIPYTCAREWLNWIVLFVRIKVEKMFYWKLPRNRSVSWTVNALLSRLWLSSFIIDYDSRYIYFEYHVLQVFHAHVFWLLLHARLSVYVQSNRFTRPISNDSITKRRFFFFIFHRFNQNNRNLLSIFSEPLSKKLCKQLWIVLHKIMMGSLDLWKYEITSMILFYFVTTILHL